MSSLRRIRPRKRPGVAAADVHFRAAEQHHHAGRWAEAEHLYREAIAAAPRHADALHMLGLLAQQTGRPEISVSLVARAIASDGRRASFHNTLGTSLLALGRAEAAEAAYRHALALAPDAVEVRNNLGMALLALGRLDEAIACYRGGLERAPDNISLLNNIGHALQRRGRLDDAMVVIRRALLLAPTDADAHNNLGSVLLAQGDASSALTACDQALIYDSMLASAHNNRANILMALGRVAEAVAAYQRAIALSPAAVEVYRNLGVALHRCGRLSDSAAIYTHALKLAPANAELHNALGCLRKDMGEPVLASESFHRAVSLQQDFAEAHNNLGNLSRDSGDFAGAIAHYDRAMVADPRFGPAALNRAGLERFVRGDVDFAAQVELTEACGLDPSPISAELALNAHFAFGKALANMGDDDADFVPFGTGDALKFAALKPFAHSDADFATLKNMASACDLDPSPIPPGLALYTHFAFGRALADVGDYDAAFLQFRKGNILKRAALDYDGPAITAHIRSVAAHFSKSRVENAVGQDGAGIIFIVGIARSGSILLEQILASHPEVHGGGELSAFDRAARQVFADTAPRFDYGAHMDQLTPDNLARLAETYRALAPLPPGKSVLVDRQPENLLNIGLIRLALPGARIIHAMREPTNACVSCFTTLFRHGHAYTYDLAELGDYYAAYTGLMAHWREILQQGAMLEVHFEALVADFETEAQRLVRYCGLSWDDLCRYSGPAERTTAGALQVRQPTFVASKAREQRYDAHLGPLLTALKRAPAYDGEV